mgnify:CR=1 FL=1
MLPSMLQAPAVYEAREAVDFRKSIDGLALWGGDLNLLPSAGQGNADYKRFPCIFCPVLCLHSAKLMHARYQLLKINAVARSRFITTPGRRLIRWILLSTALTQLDNQTID